MNTEEKEVVKVEVVGPEKEVEQALKEFGKIDEEREFNNCSDALLSDAEIKVNEVSEKTKQVATDVLNVSKESAKEIMPIIKQGVKDSKPIAKKYARNLIKTVKRK